MANDQKPIEVVSKRPVITQYFRDKKLLRVNAAKWVNKAVVNCINHLQLNHYGATLAEVYDGITGELHAVVHHNAVGKITILFQREVKEGM